MVAGGVGINPLMAMLRSLNLGCPQIKLLYAVRKPPPLEAELPDEKGVLNSGILFFEDLITLALRLPEYITVNMYLTGDHVLAGDQEQLTTAVHKGNVTVFDGWRWTHRELVEALGEEGERENTMAYVCGPPQMTDEAVEVLKRAPGMKENQVFCEKWW